MANNNTYIHVCTLLLVSRSQTLSAKVLLQKESGYMRLHYYNIMYVTNVCMYVCMSHT